MKQLITTLALALAVLGLTAAPAQATNDRETVTMTWYLPAGVNPNTDPFTSWWPQTAAPVQDVWCQHDTYRYDTKKHRAIVDGLADDGLLTLDQYGTPEDAAVYLSHTFTFCNPKPEPSPTPTPTDTTPEPTPTPTETTPEPTPTPSDTPSETPSETPSTTPSTTPETSSSTTSPSPKRPALVQTDVPAELAATGPSSTTPLLMLAGGLLAAGVALVLARRTRKH